MWNFSLRTNQFKAENIFIALFNVCSGGVSESDRFVWDYTGRPACSGVQREKKKEKKSLFGQDLLVLFAISVGRLRCHADEP